MNIKSLRKEYRRKTLSRDMLEPAPINQFEKWFTQASNEKVYEPNAMTLATVDAKGRVTTRTVLLKVFDEKGFVFFTNYKSRKADQIAENPNVSLLFPWITIERQVAVNGKAEKIPAAESAKYFASRPRDSQLGAWISEQSSTLSSRSLLLAELEKVKNKFLNGNIPLPDFWGGFRVVPETIEFWQGRKGRLHDRFLYTKQDSGWSIKRLSP